MILCNCRNCQTLLTELDDVCPRCYQPTGLGRSSYRKFMLGVGWFVVVVLLALAIVSILD